MNAAESQIKELRKREDELLSEGNRGLWTSVEDLNETPEEQKARRSQEFSASTEKPAEDSNMKLKRRDFLKWGTAASAVMTTTACSRRPKDYLVPYVNKPEGYTYGVPVWYASSAPSGAGVLIKTREGRPIKLEGNRDHPQNEGGLGVQDQAEILNLYNPERLQRPFDVDAKKEISWDDVKSRLLSALQAASPGSVRVLSDPISGPTTQSVLDRFVSNFKAKHLSYQASGGEAMGRAYEIVAGSRRLPRHNFAAAKLIVSVDADFLGSWLNSTEFSKQFARGRQIHDGAKTMNRLISFESRFSTTGVSSDHRFKIKPSQQLRVLLSLLHQVSRKTGSDENLQRISKDFSPVAVGESLGIKPAVLESVADQLLDARSESLVVAGFNGPHSVEVQLVTIMLNSLLRNYGKSIDWNLNSQTTPAMSMDYDKLVEEALAGSISVLVIQGANPVYERPNSNIHNALSKIPLVVCVSQEMNETAKLSNLVLPESHFLESWGDNEVFETLVGIQQPGIAPLYDTKSFGEILEFISSEKPTDFQERVKATWRENFFDGQGSFSDWWEKRLQSGFTESKSSARNFDPKWSGAAAVIDTADLKETSDIELYAYVSGHMLNGRRANNPWLQELPDAISKITWTNFAAMSPGLARKLSIYQDKNIALRQNDVVRIKSGATTIELPVFIQPGMRDDVVAVALGYGREASGSIGTGIGENAFRFGRTSGTGVLQLSGMKISVEQTGRRQTMATTQRQFDLHGRDSDILQKANWDEFEKDSKAAKAGAHEIKMFTMNSETDHVYPGHRWGMAIDLTKCTGCQACIVSCYAENNVSVVGPDQVAKGRHLAWLRSDLYYSGDEENPEASFQMMMCQHCERAPCETVCPVLATVHSSDGLNDMVYNRCVGTRYCANNCPYKVRRFNYFQYSDAYAGKIPMNDSESPISLMLNPDVTVRTRGVMEKCTMCVQRIRKGVDEVKSQQGDNYKHRVPDGSINTACGESCPSEAITFGDLNDPNSEVKRKADLAQNFKVLSVLNTNPSVSYLPKIKNKGMNV